MTNRLTNSYLSAAPVGTRIRDKDRDIWVATDPHPHGITTRWRLADSTDNTSTRPLDNALHCAPFTLVAEPATPTPTPPTPLNQHQLDTAPLGSRVIDKQGDTWEAVIPATATTGARWQLTLVDGTPQTVTTFGGTRLFRTGVLAPFTPTDPAPTPTTEPADPLAAFIAHTAAHPTPTPTPTVGFTTPPGWTHGDITAWLRSLPHKTAVADNDGDIWQLRNKSVRTDDTAPDHDRWTSTHPCTNDYTSTGLADSGFGPFRLVYTYEQDRPR